MSVSAKDIALSRALRNEARAIVNEHVAAIRADLSAESIGARIKHTASEQAVEALEGTKAVVADNKLVVGLTAAGLAGWLARRPLIALLRRLARVKKPERLWPWRV